MPSSELVSTAAIRLVLVHLLAQFPDTLKAISAGSGHGHNDATPALIGTV
jgi:hypothetical protein